MEKYKTYNRVKITLHSAFWNNVWQFFGHRYTMHWINMPLSRCSMEISSRETGHSLQNSVNSPWKAVIPVLNYVRTYRIILYRGMLPTRLGDWRRWKSTWLSRPENFPSRFNDVWIWWLGRPSKVEPHHGGHESSFEFVKQFVKGALSWNKVSGNGVDPVSFIMFDPAEVFWPNDSPRDGRLYHYRYTTLLNIH